MKTGSELIAAERKRQIKAEGWTPEQDDTHRAKQMARAAESYPSLHTSPDHYNQPPEPCHDWPWSKKWWKPSRDTIRNLVKAGALIAAEIDRLQRKQP
jgi:hypothetical protein